MSANLTLFMIHHFITDEAANFIENRIPEICINLFKEYIL